MWLHSQGWQLLLLLLFYPSFLTFSALHGFYGKTRISQCGVFRVVALVSGCLGVELDDSLKVSEPQFHYLQMEMVRVPNSESPGGLYNAQNDTLGPQHTP